MNEIKFDMNDTLSASNPDTIQFFTIHTLINITHTAKPRTPSRKNFDTLINGISMRCQPLGSELPAKSRQLLSKHKIGVSFNTKTKNVWSWTFFIDQEKAITLNQLVHEVDGMPVLDTLTSVNTKDITLKNTYFEESYAK